MKVLFCCRPQDQTWNIQVLQLNLNSVLAWNTVQQHRNGNHLWEVSASCVCQIQRTAYLLRFNDKIQCSSVVTAGEGCIYQTRVLCPYISELWVLILSGKQEWQKVCCCPADLRSTRVTVCHVPPGLQTELQAATFLDPGKNCQVGPMLVYRLPDVNSRIQNSDEPDVHIYDIDRCYGKATFNVDSDSESECGILGAVTVPHRYVADTDSASDSELDVEVNHAVIVGLNTSDSD